MVLLWRLSPPTVVKMCLIVLCFHTAAFLFFWEEMFPLSVWKQAAGQLQVSLFLAVRSLGLHIYYLVGFFVLPAHVNQPDLQSVTSYHRWSMQNPFPSFCHHYLYHQDGPYLSVAYFLDRASLIGLIYALRCNFIAFLKWFYKMDNP